MNPAGTARIIVDDILIGARFAPLRGDLVPPTLDQAYDIQDEVYRLLSADAGWGPLAGHKIALTSPAIQELCGVDTPVYGSIFASSIRHAPCDIAAADFMRLGLEFEIAIELAHDLPPENGPVSDTDLTHSVANVRPAFELIDDRCADYSDLDAASILTDRCWCAGIVLGAPFLDWQALDLAGLDVDLSWNDHLIDQAQTGDALGSPLAGLRWIADHLHARGRTLQKGDVIMTGSSMKTRFPKSGDRIVFSVADLGDVAVRVS
ncbi:MAG: fumarylacetoacetate hydrolase family protein [Pseudomonadota bacterium]